MSDLLFSCEFAFSVAEYDRLPKHSDKEVVFAGRSNSGKSSVINALTGRKSLARASKTPGRTQLINFFSLKSKHFLVDLPGYGFARAPRATKKNWEVLLTDYLSMRSQICGLVLIMDIRHPMQEKDIMLLNLFTPTEQPFLVLLNKADKLSNTKREAQRVKVLRKLDFILKASKVEVFSATSGLGVGSARKIISQWFR